MIAWYTPAALNESPSPDRLNSALERLRRSGADHAEIRWLRTESESVRVRNGIVVGLGSGGDAGFGVRVLAGGAWGFASSDDPERGLERAADLALEIARAAALAVREPVRLPELPPSRGVWRSEVRIDPFAVPLERKIALLMEATEAMRGNDRIVSAEGEISLFRQHKIFAATGGTLVEQFGTETGGGIVVTAAVGGEVQRRSYPNSYGGNHASRGYEFLEAHDFLAHAPRLRDEALALLDAPKAPAGVFDLLVGASQVGLQVHESAGHPMELDRIFGTELSLAGGSFLSPDMLGHFAYGSPHVTIVADATIPGGPGSFGWDDEGVPARRTTLVDRGTLVDFLSSRETAARIGRPSGGTMRADSWSHMPLIRMVNVNLEPGTARFEDILADTKKGFLIETNKSWSIDDLRLNFQFSCEIAWEIENGRLGRIYKNPVYTGITPRFWGSCDAVANRDSWTLWGIPHCGKGDPMQVVRVAHGAAPARFRAVEMQ